MDIEAKVILSEDYYKYLKNRDSKLEYIDELVTLNLDKEKGINILEVNNDDLAYVLGNATLKDIDKIKMQIPTYQKGEKKGEIKRITIKPEDLANENLLREIDLPKYILTN